MLRQALLTASRNPAIKTFATTTPGVGDLVTQFAAGETTHSAISATTELASQGFLVTLDHLGEDTTDVETASSIRDAYVELLQRLGRAQLAARAEVSVKLSAVGQALPADGPKLATENARLICEVARDVGTTVTLDMEDHTTTDLTLSTLSELRQDFPSTGAVLQAYLHRTEQDCQDLSDTGSRVRLCKGAYHEPESVAFQDRREVDLSFVRCLKVLLQGTGYPMIATHDGRLIAIAEALCSRFDRQSDDHEFQMLYGVRRGEQRRLLTSGQQVRVYVPYGSEWYGYLVRRMAERPANLMLGVRAMLGRGSNRLQWKDDVVTDRVAILGAGKMGEALLSGLLRAGKSATDLTVTTQGPERASTLAQRYGVDVVPNAEAVKSADTLVIAVKPQDMGALLAEIGPHVSAEQLVVSVAAGITTEFIEKRLGPDVPVVRVMSNTPVLVDQAMSAISSGSHAQEQHLKRAEELLQPVGNTIRVPESQQDAVTALSGSGPAYFFYLVEAMTDAGILLGLPRAVAHDLIVQTAIGAAVMLRDSGESPQALREAVMSPAGTTIAAIREMEDHKVRAAFLAALEAARDRSRELASGHE